MIVLRTFTLFVGQDYLPKMVPATIKSFLQRQSCYESGFQLFHNC
jgi:hypothetical protein